MSFSATPNWDLERFFPGGPTGEAFQGELRTLTEEIDKIALQANALGTPGEDPEWMRVLPALQALGDRVEQLQSYTACISAAYSRDLDAREAEAAVNGLTSRLEIAWTHPVDRIARADDADFHRLCAQPGLEEVAPGLHDIRREAPLLLSSREQLLRNELSEDGYHGWHELYDLVSSELVVEVGGESISPAQAHNRLDDANRAVRTETFAALGAAWERAAPACALALSHITGFRAATNRRLGIDELTGPLIQSRIRRETLEVMLAVCQSARPILWRYLALKARLLGQEQLDWCDLHAPVSTTARSWGWGEAQEYIVSCFGSFSQEMAAMARGAFEDAWVEAEDRPGKRHGAFCTPFPTSHEARVFMTFGGSTSNLLTLAHELGHAYHDTVLTPLPRARRMLPMTLAETASTFGEALVRGRALQDSKDEAEELALLDQDLADAVTFLINIPVRFHFERSLFTQRAQGPLTAHGLSATMEGLQRAWYGDGLRQANPLFWAEKLHFYMTSAPFYNFPYTFGYLFSGLVHQHAIRRGPAWSADYAALLRDTGSGMAEPTAARHLGVALDHPATWRGFLGELAERVDRYEALAARSANQSPS